MNRTHLEVISANDTPSVTDGQLLEVFGQTKKFFYLWSWGGAKIIVSKKTGTACYGQGVPALFNV